MKEGAGWLGKMNTKAAYSAVVILQELSGIDRE